MANFLGNSWKIYIDLAGVVKPKEIIVIFAEEPGQISLVFFCFRDGRNEIKLLAFLSQDIDISGAGRHEEFILDVSAQSPALIDDIHYQCAYTADCSRKPVN